MNPGSITSLLATASVPMPEMCKLLPELWEEAAICSPGESLQQECVCLKGMSRAKALPKSSKSLSNFNFGVEVAQKEMGSKLGQGDIFVSFSGRESLRWDQGTSPRCWVMQLLLQLRVQERAQGLQLGGIFWESTDGKNPLTSVRTARGFHLLLAKWNQVSEQKGGVGEQSKVRSCPGWALD